MAAMDKIDRKILAVLQADARASLQEIGQAVGLSPSPCWGRIKKMEEAGVIQGYTVRINPQALEDRKSTRLNSSHLKLSRMPSSA